ncbi:hypothetical protein GIB67_007009 [Kingdonia uniflora]|uniref:Uncharacterized protein n=1 Tax=Kingdonia uniflora TaxID=39325 RepID=A0A7J7NZ80_9MAGN|nr:hypothetical protein GIB67_007009 [Kingdonia uniflora]
MSEEEFGLPRDRLITLPCDMVFMKYVITVVQSCDSKDLEKSVLVSIAMGRQGHPWTYGALGELYKMGLLIVLFCTQFSYIVCHMYSNVRE